MAAAQIRIALFRGINVGGHNPLPMKTLPTLFEKCGCKDARTYIQSGNVVFRSSVANAKTLASRIGKAVLAAHEHEPLVFILSDEELQHAAKGNPFKEADANPKALHLFFLAEPPRDPDLASLEKLKTNGEDFALKGSVFYLYTPAGFGTSKLAAKVERALRVDMTARNWRTCQTLIQMAAEL